MGAGGCDNGEKMSWVREVGPETHLLRERNLVAHPVGIATAFVVILYAINLESYIGHISIQSELGSYILFFVALLAVGFLDRRGHLTPRFVVIL